MTNKQINFLKSCLQLPGLYNRSGNLTYNDFLENAGFVFSLCRQISFIKTNSFRFYIDKYLEIGQNGFAAQLTLNENEYNLVLVLNNDDNFTDAIKKLLSEINKNICQAENENQGLSNFHFIEADGEYYIGFLPSEIPLEVNLEDLDETLFNQLSEFPFKAFSYQTKTDGFAKLLVDEYEEADLNDLEALTGLELSYKHEGSEWFVLVENSRKEIDITYEKQYDMIVDHINALIPDHAKKLYLRSFPWYISILVFLTEEERKQYEDLAFFEEDRSVYRIKDEELKKELIETYLETEPDDTSAWASLSTCYGNLGEHEESLEIVEKYLPLDRENFVLLNNKVIALTHLKRLQEALDAAYEAIAYSKGDTQTWYFVGTCFTQLGKYDKAISILRYTTEVEPERLFNWFALGYAYYKINDFDNAIENYKRATEVSEDGTDQAAVSS